MDTLFENRLRGLEARVERLEAGSGRKRPSLPRRVDERIAMADTADLRGAGGATINEFCKKWKFSRSTFYNEQRAGRGPEMLKVGNKGIISPAAEKAWCEQRQQAWREQRARAGGEIGAGDAVP